MRIDLRRSNIGMPEHFLNDPQIAAIIQQVRGKTVAECVRLDILGEPGNARMFLDQMPDGFRAQAPAARREKNLGLRAIVPP